MRDSDDMIIHSRERDLGGFWVHRSLPSAQKRQVGPFVFLDHMGPFEVDDAHFLNVRPHPHIGLATVTYLFEGRGFHRDSLGSKQVIVPGDLNWMTAGRGIVHSERTPEEDRASHRGKTMHGVQIWIGLPVEHEEIEPSFAHWPKESFPKMSLPGGLKGKILLGKFESFASPVKTLSPTLFMDLQSIDDAEETLSFDIGEVGFYLVSGSLRVNDKDLGDRDLVIVADPKNVKLHAGPETRFIVIGGDAFPEPRHIWWNFVSSRKERIHQAAHAWRQKEMGSVEGDDEFIPLPNDPLP